MISGSTSTHAPANSRVSTQATTEQKRHLSKVAPIVLSLTGGNLGQVLVVACNRLPMYCSCWNSLGCRSVLLPKVLPLQNLVAINVDYSNEQEALARYVKISEQTLEWAHHHSIVQGDEASFDSNYPLATLSKGLFLVVPALNKLVNV